MKHNPSNIGRFGWPRRIADPVDRQTVIALAAVAASCALILGVTFLGTAARGAEVKCPMMTVTEFADRLVEIRSDMKRLLLAYRSNRYLDTDESFVFRDLDFLEIAALCFRERDRSLERSRSGR